MQTTLQQTSPSRRRAWTRVALVAVGVLTVTAAAGVTWLRATSDVRAVGTSCSEVPVSGATGPAQAERTRTEVCDLMDGLADAWARGDAEAYGSHFTDDATYAAFTGTVYQGRDDIVAGHDALFSRFLAGTRLAQSYLSVRLVGPDVAVVVTRGDTYEGDDDGSPTKVQTHVLVRDDGRAWRVASFQNTQRRPLMERVQFLVEPGSRPAAER